VERARPAELKREFAKNLEDPVKTALESQVGGPRTRQRALLAQPRLAPSLTTRARLGLMKSPQP
jgi:hypothetical protein